MADRVISIRGVSHSLTTQVMMFVDMQIPTRTGFILLLLCRINGQPISFCEEQFCYNSDGLLKNISKLEDAQDYCYKNDSWLLEIYDSKQLNSISTNITGRGPTLLNTIGKVAYGWTSIFDDPLTSKINQLYNINMQEKFTLRIFIKT